MASNVTRPIRLTGQRRRVFRLTGFPVQTFVPPEPSFTGAYDDISNIAALYGFRRGKTSYESNLIRLRRSSDNDELDIGYVGNGDLDTDAAATFIGGGSGFITTWYDQSGSGFDATQATAANQPLYVASGQNGKPVVRFDGVNDRLINASFSLSQPTTNLIVGKLSSASNVNGTFFDSYNSVQHAIFYASSTSQFNAAAGGTSISMGGHSTAWRLMTAVMNGSSSATFVNGAPTGAGNAGAQGLSGLSIGGLRGNPNPIAMGWYLNGDIAEFVIADAVWSTADREAAEQASSSYWGITLS